ncbi:MAG: hypothetical protein ABI878_15495 [Acidobacteriota bacterium]
MKFSNRSASRRTRTLFERALAFALLAGIVCGVTFGSAHDHGQAYRGSGGIFSAAGIADSAGSAYTSGSSQKAFECLLCLFHQNLFNSTVPAAVFTAASVELEVSSSAQPVLAYSNPFSSTPIARLSGRAPPTA